MNVCCACNIIHTRKRWEEYSLCACVRVKCVFLCVSPRSENNKRKRTVHYKLCCGDAHTTACMSLALRQKCNSARYAKCHVQCHVVNEEMKRRHLVEKVCGWVVAWLCRSVHINRMNRVEIKKLHTGSHRIAHRSHTLFSSTLYQNPSSLSASSRITQRTTQPHTHKYQTSYKVSVRVSSRYCRVVIVDK